MAKYPIKMLLDELKRPFFPLVTIDTIVTNNSDKTLRQLFEERYTKEEVDKLISDLGTLQRLRGTVNSYEELLAIEDPMPGDTYILLVEGGNNAEYMYIGDKWEALGPTASYTDVYSKEVVDEMLLALKQELNTKTERDDAEVLEQAKLYAEDLFANVPAPDMSEYYKKSEADAKIDEKINAIPVSDLWHYKGHVDTVDDLPFLGQPSAEAVAPITDLSSYIGTLLERLNTKATGSYGAMKINATISLVNSGGYQNYGKYYFAAPQADSYSGFALFITDYPEQIKIAPASNFQLVALYDESKPVYSVSYNWNDSKLTYTLISADSTGTYLTRSDTHKLTNIPTLKFNTTGSVLINDYYYDADSAFLSLSDGQLVQVTADMPEGVNFNDLYLVGEHNDAYLCDKPAKWTPVNERVEAAPGTGVVINRWEGVA